jgi:hypothetical protein
MISALILDIRKLWLRESRARFGKIWREPNEIAHNLAQLASYVPLCIQDLVLNERYRCWNPTNIT